VVGAPEPDAVWTVAGDSRHGFTFAAGARSLPVRLSAATGCADYPEGQLDATGRPFSGKDPEATVTGTIDAHTHVTAFEFLGGSFHCGKPWDAFGIPFALPDCKSVQQGTNGQVESFLDYGAPGHAHDTRGWPTFHDWPSPTDLAEEGDYYTGIKRAWMAGLRVMVSQLVDNEALCDLMTQRKNPCDDMAAVHIQAADLRALQNYIDAQSGGPGKGFFRIVTNPFQARAAVNAGKLAVVEGIEVSDLFHCANTCSQAQVDSGLADVKALGVSTFFPVHKFDNAFGGARMDSGEEGVLINGGNHLESGHYFDVKTCTGPEHDNTQMNAVPAGGLSTLLNGPGRILGTDQAPVYPAPPHCNALGLSSIGGYLINQMISRHFIVELDHMDVQTGNDALKIISARHYSGVISAHSWDDPLANAEIYRLGGFVTPIAGASPQSFIDQWTATRKVRDRRFYAGAGFGYGADMNGLAEESQPTSGHPITYPFRSFDGRVTFTREQWGQRTFDLNRDGVANYGMFADWLQELQTLAGRPIAADMFHGAEAYLQMWERAYGVPATRCLPARGTITARGIGPIRLGATTINTLYAAGQPSGRPGRTYRYCVQGGGTVVAAFTPGSGKIRTLYTNARGYRFAGSLRRVRTLTSRGRRVVSLGSASTLRQDLRAG
jgi:microsomal dipeptidase-like Zn-dependent dipeptidase